VVRGKAHFHVIKEGFREEINIRFLSNPILGIQNLELDKDETFERRIKAISVVPA
jgi:hypothetical protein